MKMKSLLFFLFTLTYISSNSQSFDIERLTVADTTFYFDTLSGSFYFPGLGLTETKDNYVLYKERKIFGKALLPSCFVNYTIGIYKRRFLLYFPLDSMGNGESVPERVKRNEIFITDLTNPKFLYRLNMGSVYIVFDHTFFEDYKLAGIEKWFIEEIDVLRKSVTLVDINGQRNSTAIRKEINPLW
ncbi:MAG: hypothetical protein U0U70_17530 [Chitinophagaceae bacterium]